MLSAMPIAVCVGLGSPSTLVLRELPEPRSTQVIGFLRLGHRLFMFWASRFDFLAFHLWRVVGSAKPQSGDRLAERQSQRDQLVLIFRIS